MRKKRKKTITFPVLTIRTTIYIIALAAIIFTAAGRLNYWQGWIFLGIYFSTTMGFFLMGRKDEDFMDLIQERRHPGPGIKRWDRIFFALYLPAYHIIFIIAGFDSGRFNWSGNIPLPLYIACSLLYIGSNIFAFWAVKTNRFFSSVVRIQTERGHTVVDTGPYSIIRHPGYTASFIMTATIPIILGSLWALIPAGIVIFLFIIRTYLEDTTLQEELEGYSSYTERVRYRLIPGFW